MESALWPARLNHIIRESDRPEELVDFYSLALAMSVQALENDTWLLHGPQRCLLIRRGQKGGQPLNAFCLADKKQLDALHSHCLGQQLALLSQQSPLFADGFSLRDPDDRLICFGVEAKHIDATSDQRTSKPNLAGRIQHVVVATENLSDLVRFYRDQLGFVVSDNVYDGDPASADVTACFLRSDPEHHSFAAFKAPATRPDHVCFEADNWNDIRDWADHLSSLHIKLWWGPGRHGPGNNLFFMIEDPEGYKLEVSAELEHLDKAVPARSWIHEERTLNLWGNAWMRS